MGPICTRVSPMLPAPTPQAGLDVVNILLTLIRSTAFPLGAVLIGAAIVIRTLAPRDESLAHERSDQGQATRRA
jgi:hypothetical protein